MSTAHFHAITSGQQLPDFESFCWQPMGCRLVSVDWHTEPHWTGFYNTLGRRWVTCIHHASRYLDAIDHDPVMVENIAHYDREYRAHEVRRRNDPAVHAPQDSLFEVWP